MTMGLWKDALDDASQVCHFRLAPAQFFNPKSTGDRARPIVFKFKVPRVMVYRIMCEGLERAEGITDAVDCFHQMANEVAENAITQGEQAEWFRGKQSRITYKQCL